MSWGVPDVNEVLTKWATPVVKVLRWWFSVIVGLFFIIMGMVWMFLGSRLGRAATGLAIDVGLRRAGASRINDNSTNTQINDSRSSISAPTTTTNSPSYTYSPHATIHQAAQGRGIPTMTTSNPNGPVAGRHRASAFTPPSQNYSAGFTPSHAAPAAPRKKAAKKATPPKKSSKRFMQTGTPAPTPAPAPERVD